MNFLKIKNSGHFYVKDGFIKIANNIIDEVILENKDVDTVDTANPMKSIDFDVIDNDNMMYENDINMYIQDDSSNSFSNSYTFNSNSISYIYLIKSVDGQLKYYNSNGELVDEMLLDSTKQYYLYFYKGIFTYITESIIGYNILFKFGNDSENINDETYNLPPSYDNPKYLLSFNNNKNTWEFDERKSIAFEVIDNNNIMYENDINIYINEKQEEQDLYDFDSLLNSYKYKIKLVDNNQLKYYNPNEELVDEILLDSTKQYYLYFYITGRSDFTYITYDVVQDRILFKFGNDSENINDEAYNLPPSIYDPVHLFSFNNNKNTWEINRKKSIAFEVIDNANTLKNFSTNIYINEKQDFDSLLNSYKYKIKVVDNSQLEYYNSNDELVDEILLDSTKQYYLYFYTTVDDFTYVTYDLFNNILFKFGNDSENINDEAYYLPPSINDPVHLLSFNNNKNTWEINRKKIYINVSDINVSDEIFAMVSRDITYPNWAEFVKIDIKTINDNNTFTHSDKCSMSLSGNGSIVAIWIPYADNVNNSGHVKVYKYNKFTNLLIQLGQDINGEAETDQNGWSVSLSDDGYVIAIGAPKNDGNGISSGHVRVYKYNGDSWAQLGQDIDGEAAGDQSGWSVSLSDDGYVIAIGAPNNDRNKDNSGHVRIYRYNGILWKQLGSDINGEAAEDQSGYSVSLSSDGSIVAIGAPEIDGNGDNSGYVKVYKYNENDSWEQLGYDINGEAAGDLSGHSVSLSSDGSIVAILSPGNNNVKVYKYDENGSWVKLGLDINGKETDDYSGSSVLLSSDGSIVAIRAIENGENGAYSGHVRVYQYDNTNTSWAPLGQDITNEYNVNTVTSFSLNNSCTTVAIGTIYLHDNTIGDDVKIGDVKIYKFGAIKETYMLLGNYIYAEAPADKNGYSVSLSSNGSIVAIGAVENDGNGDNSGHVRVYKYNGDSWVQLGQDIDGEVAYDQSGYSISLSSDGSIVAIGTPYNGGNGFISGHVRVYQYNENGLWSQLGQDIDGEAEYDYAGWSVSLSSDGYIVAIGAPYNDGANGTNSGHVRVYKYNENGSWEQLGEDIDGEAYDRGGWSVSLSDDGYVIAIGIPYNDGNGYNSGNVRVYKYNENSSWVQLGQDIYGEADYNLSGYSISLSSDGDIVAIGAHYNDGENKDDSGHVRVYQYNDSNSSWEQLGEDIDGEAKFDKSGWSVSLSGNGSIVAIGTPYVAVNGNNSGHVRVYEFKNGSWVQLGQDINGEANEKSGYSVSLSSDGYIVAIGAIDVGIANDSGGKVGVYNIFNNFINNPKKIKFNVFVLDSSIINNNIIIDDFNKFSTKVSSELETFLDSTKKYNINIENENNTSNYKISFKINDEIIKYYIFNEILNLSYINNSWKIYNTVIEIASNNFYNIDLNIKNTFTNEDYGNYNIVKNNKIYVYLNKYNQYEIKIKNNINNNLFFIINNIKYNNSIVNGSDIKYILRYNSNKWKIFNEKNISVQLKHTHLNSIQNVYFENDNEKYIFNSDITKEYNQQTFIFNENLEVNKTYNIKYFNVNNINFNIGNNSTINNNNLYDSIISSKLSYINNSWIIYNIIIDIENNDITLNIKNTFTNEDYNNIISSNNKNYLYLNPYNQYSITATNNNINSFQNFTFNNKEYNIPANENKTYTLRYDNNTWKIITEENISIHLIHNNAYETKDLIKESAKLYIEDVDSSTNKFSFVTDIYKEYNSNFIFSENLDTSKLYRIYFDQVNNSLEQISFMMGNSINDIDRSKDFQVVDINNPYTLIYQNNQWLIPNIVFKLIDSYGNGWNGAVMFVDEDLNPENNNEIKFELANGSEKTEFAYLDTTKMYKIYFDPDGDFPNEISFKIGNSINNVNTSNPFELDNKNPYILTYQNNQWIVNKSNIVFKLIGNSNEDGWNGVNMVIDEDINSTYNNEIKFTLNSGTIDNIEIEYLDIAKTYKIYFDAVGSSLEDVSFQFGNSIDNINTSIFNVVENPYLLNYQNDKWVINESNIVFKLKSSYSYGWNGAVMFVDEDNISTNDYEIKFELASVTEKTEFAYLDTTKIYKIYFNPEGNSLEYMSFQFGNSNTTINDTKIGAVDSTIPYTLYYKDNKWVISNIEFNLNDSNTDSSGGATMVIDEDHDFTNGNEIKFELTSGTTNKKELAYLDIAKTYKIYFNPVGNSLENISFSINGNTESFEAVDSTNPRTLTYQNNEWIVNEPNIAFNLNNSNTDNSGDATMVIDEYPETINSDEIKFELASGTTDNIETTYLDTAKTYKIYFVGDSLQQISFSINNNADIDAVDSTDPHYLNYKNNQWVINEPNIAFNLNNSNTDNSGDATMVINEAINSTNNNGIKFTLDNGITNKKEFAYLDIDKMYKIYFDSVGGSLDGISFQFGNSDTTIGDTDINAVNSTTPYYLFYQNNQWIISNIVFKLIDSYGDGWNGAEMFVDEDLNPENNNEIKFELANGSEKTEFAYLDTTKMYKIYFDPDGEYPDEISFKIGNSIDNIDTQNTFILVKNDNPYTLIYQNNKWVISNIVFKLIDSYGDGWNGVVMFVDEDDNNTNGNEIKFELASGSKKTEFAYLDTTNIYKMYFDIPPINGYPEEVSFKVAKNETELAEIENGYSINEVIPASNTGQQLYGEISFTNDKWVVTTAGVN